MIESMLNFLIIFFIFQQLKSQISCIDQNGVNPFCDKTLHIYHFIGFPFISYFISLIDKTTKKRKFHWKVTSNIRRIFVVQSLLGSLVLALHTTLVFGAQSCACVQWQWKTLIKSRLRLNRVHPIVIPWVILILQYRTRHFAWHT